MGIVNVTPDSFSDGGLHATTEAAVAWGLRLLDDGADMLDVGGESTRPGFTPVPDEEEIARVVPVVRALAGRGALVSVDTRHAAVARAAVEAGACVVNDVDGFEDPAMADAVAETGCGCVCMRPRRSPHDPGAAIAWLVTRAEELQARGIAKESICLDLGVGAGFDLNADEDVRLQRETRLLVSQGYPVLCAVSRKRFVGALSGVAVAADRDAGSVGVAIAAVTRGARVVRVHDVAHTSEVLRTCETTWGKNAPRRALVALGANLGDRVETLRAATRELAALPVTELVAASHVYDTEPAYLDEQPAFANAVVELATELHPMALSAAIHGIEDAHHRTRTVANGPRTLDLDLLWMEGETHAGDRLTLPHPRMGERDFVLTPLAELLGGAGASDGARKGALAAFCAANGIALAPSARRVGRVTADLGPLTASPEGTR